MKRGGRSLKNWAEHIPKEILGLASDTQNTDTNTQKFYGIGFILET